ncbi:MAG: O-antigen ligase family protein [Candidatus Hydrogenedentes bacterium]|nr:O-antigen ligase family protein [Candidatus Hydrogenedentota bacterium]
MHDQSIVKYINPLSRNAAIPVCDRFVASRPGVRDVGQRSLVYVTLIGTAVAWSMSLISFLDAKQLVLWAGVLALCTAGSAARSGRGFAAWAPAWTGLAAAMIATLAAGSFPLFAGLEALRLTALLLFASLAWPLFRNPRGEQGLLAAIAAACLLCAALALLQRAGALNRWFPPYAHYDQPMYSVFGNQGLLGAYLACGLVALASLRAPARPLHRLARGAGAVLLLSAILLAETRAAWVGVAAGGIVLIARNMIAWRRAAAWAAIAVALAILLHAAGLSALATRLANTGGPGDDGGNTRAWIVRASLDLAAAHPFTGVGLGQYARHIPEPLGARATPALGKSAERVTYHAHLDLLEVGCETGILGLVFAVWLAMRFRARATGALACLAALAAMSFLHPLWYSPPHALAGLLFLGCNLRGPRSRRARLPGFARQSLTVSLAIAGSLAYIVLALYPSYLLCRAEDRHVAGLPAGDAYARATAAWGAPPEAFESRGIWALEQGYYAGADRAFTRARAGLDTGRIHLLSAQAKAALGDGGGACRHYGQALQRWPFNRGVRHEAEACFQDFGAPISAPDSALPGR